MLCPACQKKTAGDKRTRKRAGNVRDQLCSRCGRLLGPEDTVKREHDKQSQLERFGLGETRDALLERRRGRDDRREDR
jgi:hypothetical protein